MTLSDLPPPYEDAVKSCPNTHTFGYPQALTESTTPCSAVNGTTIRTNLVSATMPIFGPNPVETDCPYCLAHIVTSTVMVDGLLPYIIMVICILLGFFLLIPWCLCFMPFCMERCQDVIHSCPKCKRDIGRFARI